MYSKDYRRSLRALTIFIFILTYILSNSFVGHCDIVPDEYMPSYLYDGFKSITQNQVIYELQGQPTQIETSTTYLWIDGIQQISGVNCWRTYSSTLGFYKDYSDEAKTNVSYSTLIGDENRIYGSYLSLKDGSTTTTRFYPYFLCWKYGQQIGSQYTYSYSGDLETISNSSNINCTLDGTEVFRLIGYETIVGPFGTFENCLKWERDWTTTQTCFGYSITNNTKETFWSALNKGVVKYIGQGEGGKTTAYYDIEVVSSPPGSPDSDGDGIFNIIENQSHCLDPNDADTDDDGIPDGVEDVNKNGVVDNNETDPCNIDTDGDGIQDGTELGYTLEDIGSDTDVNIFQPDLDPLTTTDPLNVDTDGDGLSDGDEDANHNGRVDQRETDPIQSKSKAMPWIPLLLLDD
jgi:hypothetical protein